MKIKKTSLTALLVAFFLVGGVTTVFATSASENLDNNNISTEIGTVMSRKVSDDSPEQYSIDNGATWISEAAYNAMYPQKEIVWWTYDEYKDWIKEYLPHLQSYVGSGAKYEGSDGQWTEWTQERVNAIIQREKETLESIKNGTKVSKTINGDIGVSYSAVTTNQNGEVVDLGEFSSKEEWLTAVKQYCEKQVKDETMSKEEADKFMAAL